VQAQSDSLPPGSIEIIVVDNVSSDRSLEMLREEFPNVALIENSENLGFARATNQGTRIAKGRFILYLNPDTEMHPGALNTLHTLMENTPSAGAVGARLINPDGSLQAAAYPFPNLFREFWRLFHLDRLRSIARYPLQRWDPEQAHVVDAVMGACILLRRQALDAVGLLDEDYFIYTEEVDLCYRLKQAGWDVYWEPRSIVLHHGGQSTRQRKTEMFLRLYESKIHFFRKHHGLMAANIYKGILGLACLPRLLMEPLGWLLGTGERKQQKELANNYLQLLRALPTM